MLGNRILPGTALEKMSLTLMPPNKRKSESKLCEHERVEKSATAVRAFPP